MKSQRVLRDLITSRQGWYTPADVNVQHKILGKVTRPHSITLVFVILCTFFLIFLFFLPASSAQGNVRAITFIGDPSCPICAGKEQVIQNFATTHPEIQITYDLRFYYSDPAAWQDLATYFAHLGIQNFQIPAVVLNNSGSINILFNDEITLDNFNAWLAGTLTQGAIAPLDFGVVLGSSIIIGLSTCVLLLLSALGASLVAVEKRGQYFAISAGLLIGIVSTYVLVSVVFLAFLESITVFTYVKYLFGGILLVIGIWQVAEAYSERSIIFGTPERVKSIMKSFIERRSGWYAFLLGMLFALVKIPCFGGVYLEIIFTVRNNPLLFYYILTYFIGMVLPVAIVLILLRVGLQSEKINAFRTKYRPYLRIASGLLLIILTVYLLFWPS